MGFGTSEGGAESTTTGAENVSVGSTTTEVVAANVARKGFVCVNDSDEEIYLGIGESAVMNKGIRLNASGGSFELQVSGRGGTTFLGAINAICSSGSKTLTYAEW
jgi:hypothetical protein